MENSGLNAEKIGNITLAKNNISCYYFSTYRLVIFQFIIIWYKIHKKVDFLYEE